MATRLRINDKEHDLDVPGDMPLLWALRDIVQLTGTKFGCGISQCGACTVHVDGKAEPPSVTTVTDVEVKDLATIDDNPEDATGQRVQQAWLDLGVAQCGYCQGGQIMAATALLKESPQPDEDQIREAMNGNLCRCGTYNRIMAAVKRVSGGEEQA